MTILLIFYCVGGLLLTFLSLPLLAEKIKPNPFYGFRVKQTLNDPAIWYATNKYFAKWQLVIGLITICAAVGFYYWPGISLDAYALACLGAFGVAFGIGIARAWAYMKNRVK